MWSISTEIGVCSPDMEANEIVEKEPQPRMSPGESLHIAHFRT
jgi:hypothetical protein